MCEEGAEDGIDDGDGVVRKGIYGEVMNLMEEGRVWREVLEE